MPLGRLLGGASVLHKLPALDNPLGPSPIGDLCGLMELYFLPIVVVQPQYNLPSSTMLGFEEAPWAFCVACAPVLGGASALHEPPAPAQLLTVLAVPLPLGTSFVSCKELFRHAASGIHFHNDLPTILTMSG